MGERHITGKDGALHHVSSKAAPDKLVRRVRVCHELNFSRGRLCARNPMHYVRTAHYGVHYGTQLNAHSMTRNIQLHTHPLSFCSPYASSLLLLG